MIILTGTDWGAHHSILRKTYTNYVRPTLEYGSIAWGTAAKTNTHKLDKVQNIGMRIMTGAFKTTPIRAIKEIATLASLDDGRELKIITQVAKMEALKSKLHNTGKKNRLKRAYFTQEASMQTTRYKLAHSTTTPG